MTDREIEVWNKGKQAPKGKEYVAIYSGDQISIPSTVYEQHLSGIEAVTIQYSKNTEEIGIKPSEKDNPNSYNLGSGTKTVNCKSFLETYNLRVNEVTKHPITVESDTIWVNTQNTI